ncbi:MAG: ATP-binding cassette domain-containing protein [Pseudomonadota bacterium]
MIKLDGLTKTYGRHTVVDNLSFASEPGEVLGFLGPNGAGKSTTMKMVTGFVAPTGGTASVCNFDVRTQSLEARQHLGYLPEGAPCYAEMTPGAFLAFIADIRGLQGSHRAARLEEVIERLHLGAVLEQSFETLSKGFKRRVGLAQAILHDPDVLILDEPTDGLDPNQKHEVRELIRSMSSDKLIVISTHILEEVEALCNRAIIIARGRILADDTPTNLAAQSRYHNSVKLSFDDAALIEPARAALSRLSSVDETEADITGASVTAIASGGNGQSIWREVSTFADEQGWALHGIHQQSGHLDEVFRQITGGAAA